MAGRAYLAFDAVDAEAARRVAAELEREGWSTVLGGEDASLVDAQRMAAVIAASDFVVLIASPAAAASARLQGEIAAALGNARDVLVVRTAPSAPASWIDEVLDRDDAYDLGSPEALSRLAQAARERAARGRVIAMLNIKGGVGKTVLGANLFAAAHLADGRSVSFVDLDPQHNLTQYFLPAGERSRLREEGRTVHAVLDGGAPDLASLPVPLARTRRSGGPGFELIAGDERLFQYTLDTRSETDKAAAFKRFRALIGALRKRSDAVVIDANPCATFLTRLAIASADHIVAPVRPEKYSLSGLNMLEQVVRTIRGRPLRASEFSVLLNGMRDRTRSSESGDADRLTREEIEAAPFFSGALLAEEIPYSAVLRSGPSGRLAANPINVTAMMRVGGRPAKEALTAAAAAILKRAAS